MGFKRLFEKAAPPEAAKLAANPVGPSFRIVESQLRTDAARALPPASIVVPIYNALDCVRACVDSVLEHTRPVHEILLIDDCSPDERIWPLLEQYATAHPNITAVRNKTNLGYTATVNIGCELTAGDVVLLNSDTLVTPNWLEKLAACAYSRPGVATVTAVSNAAGAFSIPVNEIDNTIPKGMTAAEYARWVEALTEYSRPEVPTGNGFCMYVCRRALQKTGLFDARTYPAGFGEENDFCMRAKAKGMVNLVDDATFIAHLRTQSFGVSRRDQLAKEGKVKLVARFPDYNEQIKAWLRNDPVDGLRQKLLAADPAAGKGMPNSVRPVLLAVVHSGGGGTRYMVEDLLLAIESEYRGYLLETETHAWTLFEVRDGRLIPIRRYAMDQPWKYYLPTDEVRMNAFRAILTEFDVRLVHFHHLIGSGPALVEAAAASGCRTLFSVHDFYALCPTTQLLDEKLAFCAGTCTPGTGECELRGGWFRGPSPRLKHGFVHIHRAQMRGMVNAVDRFVAPSVSASALFSNHFPSARIEVIEHGMTGRFEDCAHPHEPGSPLRLVAFSNLGVSKGYHVLTGLLQLDAMAEHRWIELHLLGGRLKDVTEFEALGAKYHGPYRRGELMEKLREIQPSCAVLPSIWPETFCYTLGEAWLAGLPTFVSDLGALADRVEAHGGGWICPTGDVAAWYRRIVAVAQNGGDWLARRGELQKWRSRTVEEMAADYVRSYQSVLSGSRSGRTGAPLLS